MGTFIDQDGLLHCTKCREKKEVIITICGVRQKVKCTCKCDIEQRSKWEEKEKQKEIERNRDKCFRNTNMRHWNLANDDLSNTDLSKQIKSYVNNFQKFFTQGKGLILSGDVGTGKTYMACAIANAVIDMEYTALFTNISSLVNKIQGTWEKQEVIEELDRYSLLILDDLGAERKTDYVNEIVFNIIDSRYRSGLPFIITTNLTSKDFASSELPYQRIYDRILERCYPIKLDGKSRRKEGFRDSFEKMRKELEE